MGEYRLVKSLQSSTSPLTGAVRVVFDAAKRDWTVSCPETGHKTGYKDPREAYLAAYRYRRVELYARDRAFGSGIQEWFRGFYETWWECAGVAARFWQVALDLWDCGDRVEPLFEDSPKYAAGQAVLAYLLGECKIGEFQPKLIEYQASRACSFSRQKAETPKPTPKPKHPPTQAVREPVIIKYTSWGSWSIFHQDGTFAAFANQRAAHTAAEAKGWQVVESFDNLPPLVKAPEPQPVKVECPVRIIVDNDDRFESPSALARLGGRALVADDEGAMRSGWSTY